MTGKRTDEARLRNAGIASKQGFTGTKIRSGEFAEFVSASKLLIALVELRGIEPLTSDCQWELGSQPETLTITKRATGAGFRSPVVVPSVAHIGQFATNTATRILGCGFRVSPRLGSEILRLWFADTG